MIMYHIAFFYSNILCYVKLYIVYIVLYCIGLYRIKAYYSQLIVY